MTFYRFQAIEELPRVKEADVVQTVHFVDLPAEIRNMIYLEILEAGDNEKLPRRQPMLSLTCRLANKELLSLLFKRYGWFVRM